MWQNNGEAKMQVGMLGGGWWLAIGWPVYGWV